MKLSSPFALLAVLPLLCQVSANIIPRQGQRNGGGDNNNNAGNNDGANNDNNNNGGNDGGNDGGDPQTSLTLDPRVVADGFANDGQDVPTEGQVASLTSTNNFINHCLTVPDLPITNGKQITTGSCNPAPIGVIPSVDRMPSSKFTSPKNGDTIPSDEAFTISMAIKNMQTGAFVNAQQNYFAAPQQLNGQGLIIGHSHVVVELLDSLDQTTPTDPKKFAFFKGLNAQANNGVLTADVTAGLPAGAYRLCSINAAANHQPAIVPVAQHGSLDDCVYFTATPGGAPANDGNNGGNNNNNNDGGAAGNDGDNTGADAGDNTGADAGDNTGADAGDNTGADAGDNTGADAGGNNGADAGDNTGAGAGGNGGADAGDNTGAGAGGNSGADAGDNTGAGAGGNGGADAGDNTGAGAGDNNGAGAGDNTGAGAGAGAGQGAGGNTGGGGGRRGGGGRQGGSGGRGGRGGGGGGRGRGRRFVSGEY